MVREFYCIEIKVECFLCVFDQRKKVFCFEFNGVGFVYVNKRVECFIDFIKLVLVNVFQYSKEIFGVKWVFVGFINWKFILFIINGSLWFLCYVMFVFLQM